MQETKRENMGAGRRTKLTAELQRRICAFIRAGAYDYAAAEACGINRRTFFDWMQRGEGTSDRKQSPAYVQFVHAVRAAQAECRVTAEIEVRHADPKWWLTRMCRDQPDLPGWTNAPPTAQPLNASCGLSIHIRLDEEDPDPWVRSP